MRVTNYDPDEQASGNKSILAFGIAVCLHGVIDGIALGVFSEGQLILNLAIGLLIHRIPEAFVFGAVFHKKTPELTKTVIMTFILFIVTTPIGIGIGMGIANSNNNWAVIIL